MIKRHQLVWLNQSPVAVDPRAQKTCDAWFESGHPFIVTRQSPENELRLGFCRPRQSDHLPPQRIGLISRKDDIVRISQPPLLSDAALQCETLKPIRDLAETKRFHLYGSYLWELLTGQIYTTPASDLDVFMTVAQAQEISGAIACFQKLESRLPIRVDGEVSIEGAGEINWRELAAQNESVLLKTTTGAMLINRDHITCQGKFQNA